MTLIVAETQIQLFQPIILKHIIQVHTLPLIIAQPAPKREIGVFRHMEF